MVTCRLDSRCHFQGLSPDQRQAFHKHFSHPNPDYLKLVRIGRDASHLPRRLAAGRFQDNTYSLPRGCYPEAIGMLQRHPSFCVLKFNNVSTGEDFTCWALPRETEGLRDYQDQAATEACSRKGGFIVLPCGGGKTRTGIAAIGKLPVTALVIVPTVDLAIQWQKDIRRLLGTEALIMGGGFQITGNPEITIGVAPSVRDKLATDPDWGKRFGWCIVDECHSTPAYTFQFILNHIPAFYRLGLTATPHREDGLDMWLPWTFGPVLLQKTTQELIAEGHLQKASIEEVETHFFADLTDVPRDRHAIYIDEQLSKSPNRNSLIANRALQDARQGETILILCSRIEQALHIQDLIGDPRVSQVLTSRTKAQLRNDVLTKTRDGELPILIATSLADQGLDIPRLSRVYLAGPQRARGRTQQRIGRLLRPFPGKISVLVDFIDSRVPMLLRRARERRQVWKEMGLMATRFEKPPPTPPESYVSA